MDTRDLDSLLERIGAIRKACDLDLLMFFHRHPRALLTREKLAAFLGYELEPIDDSIARLIEAGLLTRSQNPARAARLYVLKAGGVSGALLSSLASVAITPAGRQDAMRLLRSRPVRAPAAAPSARRVAI